MAKDLVLKVNKFKAINSAEIELDGITVLAGTNSCGKSTISKLLFGLFHTQENFEDLVSKNLSSDTLWLRDFAFFLFQIISKTQISFESFDFLRWNRNAAFTDQCVQLKDATAQIVKKIHDANILKSDADKLLKLMQQACKNCNVSFPPRGNLDEILTNTIDTIINRNQEVLNNRDIRILNNQFERLFHLANVSNYFKFYQQDFPLMNEKSISPCIAIQKAVYIDTPMIIDLFSSGVRTSFYGNEYPVYWEYLFSIISKKNNIARKNVLLKKHISQTIEGSIEKLENNGRFFYKPKDSQEAFELDQCASGIKSFALLERLLDTGYLDNQTLLIVDEPEVHLHPQWVVKYAQMLVLLHKKLGVRILVSSHDPDFVSAIKYMGQKAELGQAVKFYFARKKGARYDFLPQGNDISAIFTSFNQALTEIRKYK